MFAQRTLRKLLYTFAQTEGVEHVFARGDSGTERTHLVQAHGARLVASLLQLAGRDQRERGRFQTVSLQRCPTVLEHLQCRYVNVRVSETVGTTAMIYG